MDKEVSQENKTTEAIPEWQKKVCAQTMDEWDRGRRYVSDLNEVYETVYAMLRGERPEKDYDWQSNVVINKVFQVIWTTIPYIVQKIFGTTPIIGVKSYDSEGAWQREELLDFWCTMQPADQSNHIPYFLISVQWLLRGLLNGVGVLKKTWHQKLVSKTEDETMHVPMGINEDGSLRMESHTRKTRTTYPVEDWPVNIVVNNKDIVVDWLLQPTQSIRQGRFIIHRVMTDLDELYSSNVGYFNLEKINPNMSSTTSPLRQDHASVTSRDGQQETPETDIYTDVEIYERQGKRAIYREKQDGRWIPCFDREEMYDNEKVSFEEMIEVVAKGGEEDILIRFDKNPLGEKGYVDMHIYLDAERWQSMGIVDPIKDTVTALNDNWNAVCDEINQNLMPPVIINKFALWETDTMQYAPQQKWLVGGDPRMAAMFKEPSHITSDAWRRHQLLDNEIQLTAVTNAMQGQATEKTATTNVLNAEMSASKLDFLIKMIEVTGLIPSAQMDIRFAGKFAHPLTFHAIFSTSQRRQGMEHVGNAFKLDDWKGIYRYIPAASSVKLEHQRNRETADDIQLISVLANVQNPAMPKIINVLWKNILRNKNRPDEAALLDEEYFEPSGEAGNTQMLKRTLQGRPSNQNALPMSSEEADVRQGTYEK